MTRPDVIDLTTDDLSARIEDLGARIDQLWRQAIESGDFVQLERLTSASQAMHRAAQALREDQLIGA